MLPRVSSSFRQAIAISAAMTGMPFEPHHLCPRACWPAKPGTALEQGTGHSGLAQHRLPFVAGGNSIGINERDASDARGDNGWQSKRERRVTPTRLPSRQRKQRRRALPRSRLGFPPPAFFSPFALCAARLCSSSTPSVTWAPKSCQCLGAIVCGTSHHHRSRERGCRDR